MAQNLLITLSMNSKLKIALLFLFFILIVSCSNSDISLVPAGEGDETVKETVIAPAVTQFSVIPVEGKVPLTVRVVLIGKIPGKEALGEATLEYHIDFDGDGSWDFIGNPCRGISYTYENVGTYILKAEILDTATNKIREAGTRQITVVPNQNPRITVFYASPKEGTLVNGVFNTRFYLTASDPDPGEDAPSSGITKVEYDVDGDGVIDKVIIGKNNIGLNWTYTKVGEYHVSVKVYDDSGGTAKAGPVTVRVFVRPQTLSGAMKLDSSVYSVFVTGPFSDRSILPKDFQGIGLGDYYLTFLGQEYGNVDISYFNQNRDIGSGEVISHFTSSGICNGFQCLSNGGGVTSMFFQDGCLALIGGNLDGSRGEPFRGTLLNLKSRLKNPVSKNGIQIFGDVAASADIVPNMSNLAKGRYNNTDFIAVTSNGKNSNLGAILIQGVDWQNCSPKRFNGIDTASVLKFCSLSKDLCVYVNDVLYFKNYLIVSAGQLGVVFVPMSRFTSSCYGQKTCYINVFGYRAHYSGYRVIDANEISLGPYNYNYGDHISMMKYWKTTKLQIDIGKQVNGENLRFVYDDITGGYIATVSQRMHVGDRNIILKKNGDFLEHYYWKVFDGKRIWLSATIYENNPWANYTLDYKSADLLFAGIEGADEEPNDHSTVPLFIVDVTDPANPVFLNKECSEKNINQVGSCMVEPYTFYTGGRERLIINNFFVHWPYIYRYGGNEVGYLPVFDPYNPYPSDYVWHNGHNINYNAEDNWTDAGSGLECLHPPCPYNKFRDIKELSDNQYVAANYYRGESFFNLTENRVIKEFNIGGIIYDFSPFIKWGTDYIFMAKGYGGVDLYNVSNIISPKFVSHIDIKGEAIGIYFDRYSEILYVATNNYGIRSFDFKNINRPIEIGWWGENKKIKKLVSNGKEFIFFCDDTGTSPKLYFQKTGEGLSPVIVDGYSYCSNQNMPISASNDGSNYIAIRGKILSYSLDNNPNKPKVSLLSTKLDTGEIKYTYIEKNMFIEALSKGIIIYDISNPGLPFKISQIDINDYLTEDEISRGGVIYSIEKLNDYLFVSVGSVGMFIFNISDPSQPEVIGDFRNIDATYMKILYSNGDYYSFIGGGGYSSSTHRVYFIKFSGF